MVCKIFFLLRIPQYSGKIFKVKEKMAIPKHYGLKASSSLYVTTLPGLVAKGIVVVEKNVFNLSLDLKSPRVQTVCDLMG